MPIRLNLLAEVQAAEDLRRRDPLKRAVLLGAVLVALTLAWSSSLQLRSMLAKAELNRIQTNLSVNSNQFAQVVANNKKLADMVHKLGSLERLATNRFLQAPVLNALQQAATDDIQLMRVRSEQAYSIAPVKGSQTNKPPAVTERIVLTLEGKDSGPTPGDQIPEYRQMLSGVPYFQEVLGKTNLVRLTNLGAQQAAPDGKVFVQFTMECRYPEVTR